MRSRKKIILMFLLLIFSVQLKSNTIIDSLKNHLNNTNEINDSIYLRTLLLIVDAYSYENVDSAIHYGKIAKNKAKQINDFNTIAKANVELGWNHYSLGNYKDAINYYNQANHIFSILKNKKGENIAKANLATVYKELGSYDIALKYYMQYLNYAEEINDDNAIAVIKGNIGLVYFDLKNLNKARMFYTQSLKLYKELNDLYGIARNLGNIALLHEYQNSLDSSLYLYKEALKLDSINNNLFGIARHHGNIGSVYIKMNKYNKATYHLKTALDIDNSLQNKVGVVRHLIGLSNIFMISKNYKMAEQNLLKAKELLANTKNLSLMVNVEKTYVELLIAQKKIKEALIHFENYNNLEDSLFNFKNIRSSINLGLKMEYNKKQIEDSILTAKANEIRDVQIAKQNTELKVKQQQQYALLGGVIILIIFLSITYNRFKITRKQKNVIEKAHEQLEEKNKEITDSIKYAKRIQNAILPPQKVVKEHLKDSFIIYKPKDIVAGDFYWLEYKNNNVLFSAADCTGHGVPGAMVSVVCNNGLNRSVREYGITKPGKILDKTRELVIQEFEKSEEDVKDGMDIALCSLRFDVQGLKLNEPETIAILQYAGANNPLWIVRNLEHQTSNYELIEIKPNKQPIGKVDEPHPFTTHTIELQKGDTIYIFTDGFADQFGGPKGKKFMYKPFKELLLSIQNKTMSEQKEILVQHFENWKGSLEQVDDVCVIGVRI